MAANVHPPYPGIVLQRDLQGVSVRQVQERLNELGANPVLVEDGAFGLLTEAAVILFQKANGLPADGVVELVTWNTLFTREAAADPPTVSIPYPGVVLRRGMSGPSIRQVQERLNALGANPQLATDGSFGPLTEAAVIAFQHSRGLNPDGVVGPLTWSALFAVIPAPTPPPQPPNVLIPYPGVVLRRGMSGPSIKQVQERLNTLGANPRLATDGNFGPLTEAAVIAFQRSNGLNSDGVVGPITWNALFSTATPVPPPSTAWTIVLDPGHGGSDPGAVSGGRRESDDNLRLSLAVQRLLQAQTPVQAA